MRITQRKKRAEAQPAADAPATMPNESLGEKLTPVDSVMYAVSFLLAPHFLPRFSLSPLRPHGCRGHWRRRAVRPPFRQCRISGCAGRAAGRSAKPGQWRPANPSLHVWVSPYPLLVNLCVLQGKISHTGARAGPHRIAQVSLSSPGRPCSKAGPGSRPALHVIGEAGP